LVYALTDRPKDVDLAWYQTPAVLAVVVLTVLVVLNWIFW
jgi:SSS family solute:Na+ symporter